MVVSIQNFKNKIKDVLKALDRREIVKILYLGKFKVIITPAVSKKTMQVSEHPFFGMNKNSKISVSQEVSTLRKGRYRDILN